MIWAPRVPGNWQKQPSDGVGSHATAQNLRQFEESDEESGVPELTDGFDASIKELKASKVDPAGIDSANHRLGPPDAPAAADECDALVATGVMPTGVSL